MDLSSGNPSTLIDEGDHALATLATSSPTYVENGSNRDHHHHPTNVEHAGTDNSEDQFAFVRLLVGSDETFESGATDEELLLALAFTKNAYEATPDTPEAYPKRDDITLLFAHCLTLSYSRTSNTSLLKLAIVLTTEVYERHIGHECQFEGVSGSNLIAQIDQYVTLTGDTNFVPTLVILAQQMLSHTPKHESDSSSERAEILTALGVALHRTYELTSDVRLIQEATKAQELAYSLAPSKGKSRSVICSNYAAALVLLMKLTLDETLVGTIFNLQEETLALRPPGHPLRAAALGNFSGTLKALFDQTGERRLIEQAIALEEEGLTLRPPGHPNRKITCYNLTTSYSGILSHWPNDSEKAYRRALELTNILFEEVSPSDLFYFCVLIAACNLHTITSPFQDFPTALIHLDEACRILASSSLPSFTAYQPLLKCFRHVSKRAFSEAAEVQVQVLSIFSRIADSLPLLAGFSLDENDRLELLRIAEWLGPASFACALKAGDPERGLEILEVIRGTFWSQAIHLQDPQLDELPSHLAQQLKEIM
jgi:hypothetical protein